MTFAAATSRAMLAWYEGEWGDIGNATRAASALVRSVGSSSLTVSYERRLVRIYRLTGDAKSAESFAQECLEIAQGSSSVKYEFASRVELALLCAGPAECRKLNASRPLPRDPRRRRLRGLGGRLQPAEAAAAARRGSNEEAAAHFERAIAILRNLCLPWDEAEA
jgi:hypothetical protein